MNRREAPEMTLPEKHSGLPRVVAALAILLMPVVAAPVGEAPQEERVDLEVVERIRAEGLERSQVWPIFSQLVDVFGPRLTATPAYNDAARWARDRLTDWGVADARLESFAFGRGWTLEGFVLEMIEPRYLPLMGYPRAWSPSTGGAVVGAPLMLAGLSSGELSAYLGRLAGAIVMTRPPETRFVTEDRDDPPDYREAGAAGADARWSPSSRTGELTDADRAEQERQRELARQARRQQGELADMMQQEGAAISLEPSRGIHGTLFVLGQDRDDDNAVPRVVMAPEHYNMIARLIERGIEVQLRTRIDSRYHEEDTNGYNVIAEIPGVDPDLGRQVVMIGAHLDSWHAAPGATDNADGAATALEALRILRAVGVRPRRTIRVALWGGEEQGLYGSEAFVEAHLSGDANAAARDDFSVYFNLDPGAGPVRGFFLEGNEAARPFFEANLAPFADLGPAILTMGGICCTDHLSFIDQGLPGFQPVHSYTDYDVRTHHTNVDAYEHVRPQDLRQASVVMASLLYHAAMRDQRFPRAPAVGQR